MKSKDIISQEVGAPIPNYTAHAVSVTLPTWEANVGYEEGQEWVVNKMNSGYPRFFIHSWIQELSNLLELSYGKDGERCMIFPTYKIAKSCRKFIKEKTLLSNCNVRILQLSTPSPTQGEDESIRIETNFSVVYFPSSEYPLAKQYWQHAGQGISSRMGEYILSELKPKLLELSEHNSKDLQQKQKAKNKTSRRSSSLRSSSSTATAVTEKEYSTFIEERFGRNLDLRFNKEARIILQKRISTKINEADDNQKNKLSKDDVYLFPSGMASIFNAHQAILLSFPERAAKQKSVCFGFPYVDTLNILKKWGQGVHFYGFGDDDSLLELERKLETGELQILTLVCECPSNPLLKTPDLIKIWELSRFYNFTVVVDETVGNFLNIHVLPYCDILVSSLTKVFSGDSNVMAGSLVLNPSSEHYQILKQTLDEELYEPESFWAEDAIYLERNSRDFESRSSRINENAMAAVKLFQETPLIKNIYYPFLSPTRKHYDALKTPKGGYGGLISIVFANENDARCFFNEVKLSKGPSLGTNFTLCSPYVILAYFQELDEVEKWGIDRNLIRISIGLEDRSELIDTFQKALKVVKEQHDALEE
ncbi:hypothetical protein PACTADRAFT_74498 [Pachysolen tannophilus NRRL Y-2460]|uniref:Cystathionine gamma-synthase n=1 Tax=Pachysolen tannophilus NRRL Y-2460 TaxID=669874 RepID=A0A1E4TYS3_PACTA|nr:hypothetical protein PACTADRAFT_74498 [Pachysolen tannophilus NRRL Y-2460]